MTAGMSEQRFSDYDGFAKVYNLHWGPDYAARAIPILNRLILGELPAGARILDLCCGSGHITHALVKEGYDLTGLDGSRALLNYAIKNAPKARFEFADARSFSMQDSFDAVLSLNDSLNHVMNLDELRAVFDNVMRALRPGGWFLFDLNLPHKYVKAWDGNFAIVEDDLVCAVHARTDHGRMVADFKACIFERADGWTRSDLTLYQTWYPVPKIMESLGKAGFRDLAVMDKSGEELIEFDIEKAYFRCRK